MSQKFCSNCGTSQEVPDGESVWTCANCQTVNAVAAAPTPAAEAAPPAPMEPAAPPAPMEPAAPRETAPPGVPAKKKGGKVIAIVAIVVVLLAAVGAGGYFLLKPKPYAFTGNISEPAGAESKSQAECTKDDGLNIDTSVTSDETVMGSGPGTPKWTSGKCALTFSYDLDRADSYLLTITLSDGSSHKLVAPGPTFSSSDLESNDGVMDFKAEEFPKLMVAFTASMDAGAQSSVRNALAAAKTIFTDTDSYSGLTVDALSQVEPSLTYTADSSTGPDNVSVATDSAMKAAIAVMAPSGTCFYLLDDATSGTTYGSQDDASSCVATDAPQYATQSAW